MFDIFKRFRRKHIDDRIEGFCFDESINLFTCLTCGWSCPESEALEHECPEHYLKTICQTGLMKRRVLMRRKQFDRALHDKFDPKGKRFALAELKKVGLDAGENPLKTKVDIIVKGEDGETLFYVETEIKRALDKPFSYATLQIPYRKEKYCGLDKPTLFMLFSSNGSKYFCTWDRHVSASQIAEVANTYIKSEEFFFQVPLGKTDRSLENALKRLDEETDSGAAESS